MKIGLVCRHYLTTKGGLEKYTQNLSEELVRRGEEVHVFCNAGEEKAGVHLHHVPMFPFSSPGKNLSFALNAYRVVAGFQLDVVQSMERIWSQDIFRASDGINPIQMEKKYPNRIWRTFKAAGPRRQVLSMLERRVFQKNGARWILTNSKLVKDQVCQYYNVAEKKVHVIYNSVDTSRFQLGVRDRFRGPIRAEYGLDAEQYLILFVGNGYHQKGLPELLKALPRFKKKFRLMVVGNDSETRCRRLASRLGIANSTLFLGYQTQLERLYGAADLMVLPTRYDPFANVCLEAMACGTPVVTTRMNGVCEIITHGRDGYVMDHGTKCEISARIKDFMDIQDKTEMRQKAAFKAREFSMEKHMENLQKLYAHVCEEKRR